MQSSLKVAPQAARILLCLSLFIGALTPTTNAAVTEYERSHRSGVSLRTRQDPDADAKALQAKQLAREAEDVAWKAGGIATQARAGVSKLRSKINKIVTGQQSQEAEKQGNAGTGIYLPAAQQSEAAAKASLDQALAYEAEVKGILKSVDEHAYKAAQVAATKEVQKLEGEAKKYFYSLLAKFRALADPGPPTAADAAAKAAQPYIDVELRVGALVQYYNEKAIADIAQATQNAATAKNIALAAQGEQAAGIVDMAQRHMMQAHMLVGAANMQKAGAYAVRKFAESLNMSIPSYQRAAQQAAIHALATFSGLQVGDKAHIEMRQQIAKSTQQMDKAFAELESTLAEAAKALEVVTPKDI